MTREKFSSRFLEPTEKVRILQMKLKSMEMGIYEDNKDVKSLPRSLSFTPCTNSINVTDGGEKKKVKEEKITLRHLGFMEAFLIF